ncbi:MAG: hypothetical protein ACRD2O_01290 [Terriglobia bacterium]
MPEDRANELVNGHPEDAGKPPSELLPPAIPQPPPCRNLSDRELEQHRNAARRSTGPRTPQRERQLEDVNQADGAAKLPETLSPKKNKDVIFCKTNRGSY